ncbi:ribonuclease domain-containing protein [Bacillus pseudomycoides]
MKSELYLDNKKGWVQEEGKWTYYRKDGQRVTDLQTIDGKRYYFDSNGIMQIGWLNKDGSKYYFNSSGVMQTGVQYIDGKVCYFNDLGLLSNGYHTVEGKPYYFDASQGPKSGWMKKEYEWYLLYPTGALKTGDFTYKDKKFSFNQEGEMVKGWIVLESLVKKVYPEPDLKRVLRAKHVEKGEVIEVTGKTGQWYEVKYQGKKGYVRIHDAVIFDQETKSPLTLLDGKVKIFEGVLNYLKSDETLVNDTFKVLEKIEYDTMDSIEIYNSITQDIDNRIQSIKEEREILREFIVKAKEAEKKLIKDAKDLANQTISYTIDLVGGAIDITQYTVHSVIVAAEMNEQILTQIYEGESKRIQELQSAMKDIQISQELLTEMYIKYKYGIEYQQMLQEAKNIKSQAEKFQHSLDELNKKMVPLTKETKEFMNQLHQHYGEIEKMAPGIFSDINDGLDSANNLMNTANKYASYKINIPAAARNVGNIDLTNSLRDFGVRQDKLDAYFAQQKADNQQMDFILSITPGIGTAKEVSQLALGKNINTGENYKASDYAWGTLAIASGGTTRVVGKVFGTVGELEKKAKNLEKAAKSTKFTRYPTGFDDVAKYIKEHKKLPDNYITKEQAKALGWDKKAGNLHKVAPGKSIGGNIYRNDDGALPSVSGRTWYEADINYLSGYRGNDRILYSSDGLVYKTSDHYKTFTQIK